MRDITGKRAALDHLRMLLDEVWAAPTFDGAAEAQVLAGMRAALVGEPFTEPVMSERRFTDKPDLDPKAVRELPPNHPALVERRTLFPSTVVDVTRDEPVSLLVSGFNNRKLGAKVEKGAFAGYALYGFSLEERATCPDDCAVRAACYGNGMQMARRHRIADPEVFYDRMSLEIVDLLEKHPDGILLRLHVLGDFPDVDYVAYWADELAEHPKLAIYGYTARRSTSWGGDEIGDAIESVKQQFPDRFRIRWSGIPRPDAALVTTVVPNGPRTPEGLVCPAQTDATACCATCGLCWGAPKETIVFVKHGPKSVETAARRETEESTLVVSRPSPEKLPAPAPSVVAPEKMSRDELEERVRQFETALSDRNWIPLEWGLTATEAKVMNALALREMVPKEAIHALIYGGDDDGGADPKIIDVFIFKIRKKVAPWGVHIDTIWGQGHAIRKESRAIVQALKRGEPPPPLLQGSALADTGALRSVQPIALPKSCTPRPVTSDRPDVRMVSPTSLWIEASYQRDLTGKSIRLIQKIVSEWDWSRYKPPVCAESSNGLYVIDGQHTAIAAATHPDIVAIPVMVVVVDEIEKRAESFVAHNRDRIAMSPLQIVHAEAIAGVQEAKDLLAVVERAGAIVPRFPSGRGRAKVGEVMSVAEVARILKSDGPEFLERILRIAVKASLAPIPQTVVRALRMICKEPAFASTGDLPDDRIAAAIASFKDIDLEARSFAATSGQGRDRACAVLIVHACQAEAA